MKNNKVNTICKILFFVCFTTFLTFYIAQQSGYYEYSERKKMSFTKEQIKQFEEDVKNGKEIDINDYMQNTDKNYQNKISKLTLGVSENISKYTKKGVDIIFTRIGNAIEES